MIATIGAAITLLSVGAKFAYDWWKKKNDHSPEAEAQRRDEHYTELLKQLEKARKDGDAAAEDALTRRLRDEHGVSSGN